MSFVCDVCGRRPWVGKQVSHSHRRTSRRWLPNVLIQGFFTTIRLSLWATVFATVIGTAMGLMRLSRSRFRRWVASVYVELTRNTPPLVLVFLFYFFIGEQVLPSVGLEALIRRQSLETQALVTALLAPPSRLTAFFSAVVTLSIFEGAYIAEIVRAGDPLESMAAALIAAANERGGHDNTSVVLLRPQATAAR